MSNNMQQYQDPSNMPAPYSPADSANLIADPAAFNQMHSFAQAMAQSQSMIPEHMRGNVGDCMAITMQAMQWGMNPFAVAQKTFVIGNKGILGYEAQLINAVITTNAPITGRLNFEWFGSWEVILGRHEKVDAKSGNKEKVSGNWDLKDEAGLGIRVWATIVGESEPRELTLLLAQASPRNSPLWGTDPKQQIAYLAIKRWARLYCPDVIMGVYSKDELRDRSASLRNVTPTKNKGAASLLNRVTKPIPEEDDAALAGVFLNPDDLLATIKEISQPKQVEAIKKELEKIATGKGLKIDPKDLVSLEAELEKAAKPLREEYKCIDGQISKAKTVEDIQRLREVVKDKASGYSDNGKKLNDKINARLEQIGKFL